MKKSRLKNLNDCMALIVRRRWCVMITALALCGLTVLFAQVFPKMYASQTMILIQQRDVPTDFVKDLIGSDNDERLAAIEQTILSRTNLLKILGEFEDRLPGYRALNDERKVARLRKRITIDFPSEKVRGKYLPTTSIQISYRDQSPDLAQKITARVASLFIEQDNRARENKVFGTAEFLESELKKVSDQLRQSQGKLKMLKERYRFELPSEQDTNLRTLDRLQVQKNGNLEAIDRYVTMQMNLERQISETPATISRESAAGYKPPNPLAQTYRQKDQQYKDLIVKAKPTHPDVRRLGAELEQLRKDIPPEDLTPLEVKDGGQAAPATLPNPVYQNLVSQLNQLKTDLEIRQREKKWIEDEMEKYSRRIQNTPGVEQEMLAIIRSNEDLSKQHDDLKTKLDAARLAGSLESRQKGAQFSIVDPANYPLEPAPPGKPVILLVGFVISLVAGVGVAISVNTFNQRVWTHREVERFLEAPVLVEIPSIVNPADLRHARIRKISYAAVFVLAAGVYLGGLYYLYAKQSTVLRVLDPVIEKIQDRASKT